MDEDNFEYEMDGFAVKMTGGVLVIDNAEYENNDDDPSYAFAREVARLRGLI